MAFIVVTTDGQTVAVSNGDTVIVDIPGGGTVNIIAANPNVKTFRLDFGDDDNQADTVNIDLSTFAKPGLHIDINNYDPLDSVNLIGATNTHVDPGNTDEFQFDYVGDDGNTYTGYVRAKDKGEKDFTTAPSPIIICFSKGTIINTNLGPTPIEALSIGDLVETRDHGPQPLRWIGKRELDSIDLARHPQLRPVRFAAGSLGNGLPYTDLSVSPQHRIFMSDWRSELHFGEAEILVPALSLVNQNEIDVLADTQSVTYYHLLFDAHEIITANGVASESLHAGEMALASMSKDARDELNLIFPDAPVTLPNRTTARPVARKVEAVAAFAGVA